ncbi:MAG: polyprenol phosphomannose-dependent alpha 1,6 mannosyltransferase MptB [Solirubrobacteraceae bacterium]
MIFPTPRRSIAFGWPGRLDPLWGWGALGLAGSVLLSLAGPRLVDGGVVTWWFDPRILGGHRGNLIGFYLGVLTLSVAWLGLGRVLRRPKGVRLGELWVVGGLWCLPLVLGPALFSRDVYSYLAQGAIVHLGLSPYHDAPVVLGHLGQAHLLQAVSPFWRHTTAPYGPLFLYIVSLIVSVSGSNLILGVLLLRVVELAGIVLMAVFVPRLARALGADPCRATWLALLSPLVLLELLAASHNDALMVGLLVAGVVLALERRPLLAIAVCALAATIKLPAATGVVLIAAAWARTALTRSARMRIVGQAGVVAIGVGVAVSTGTGLGFGWISSGLFSTPGKVQLAITPATGLGWTIASLLHDVGIGASARGLESILAVVAVGVTAALALVLVHRTRWATLVPYLGVVLLAAALGGPAAWPWYFSWGLVLLAACPATQRSRVLALALAASVFLVKPDGVLALPLGTAPLCVIAYIAAGGGAWYAWRRRHGNQDAAGRFGPRLAVAEPEPLG